MLLGNENVSWCSLSVVKLKCTFVTIFKHRLAFLEVNILWLNWDSLALLKSTENRLLLYRLGHSIFSNVTSVIMEYFYLHINKYAHKTVLHQIVMVWGLFRFYNTSENLILSNSNAFWRCRRILTDHLCGRVYLLRDNAGAGGEIISVVSITRLARRCTRPAGRGWLYTVHTRPLMSSRTRI